MTYFAHINYFATGEGMTHAWGFFHVSTKEEAVDRLLRETMFRGPEHSEDNIKQGIEYFGKGVDLYDIDLDDECEKAAVILKDYIAPKWADQLILSAKDHGLCDALFHAYINYS